VDVIRAGAIKDDHRAQFRPVSVNQGTHSRADSPRLLPPRWRQTEIVRCGRILPAEARERAPQSRRDRCHYQKSPARPGDRLRAALFTSVSAGKTVSRCAAIKIHSLSFAPRSSQPHCRVVSVCAGNPSAAMPALTAAARFLPETEGAGISVSADCRSLIHFRFLAKPIPSPRAPVAAPQGKTK